MSANFFAIERVLIRMARTAEIEAGSGGDLLECVFAAMRANGSPSHPKSFEIWYAHVAMEKPALSASLLRCIKAGLCIDSAEIDRLYNEFFDERCYVQDAALTGEQILAELELLTRAIGNTLEGNEVYLSALSGPCERRNWRLTARAQVRRLVETLVVTTRGEIALKAKLHLQLRRSQSEIARPQGLLSATSLAARTDNLTGVVNRRHFQEILKCPSSDDLRPISGPQEGRLWLIWV